MNLKAHSTHLDNGTISAPGFQCPLNTSDHGLFTIGYHPAEASLLNVTYGHCQGIGSV